MSGIIEQDVTNFTIDGENNWILGQAINMKGGYITNLEKEDVLVSGNVYLYEGQVVDGTDFSVVLKNNNTSEFKMIFYSNDLITIRGQWTKIDSGVYFMSNSIDDSNYMFIYCKDDKSSIVNTITDQNKVLYSVLWYTRNGINHIRASFINTDCELSKYAIKGYNSGILSSYEKIDLPEFVIMDKMTFQNSSATLTIKKGSVILTEGEYFSNNRLQVSGWYASVAGLIASKPGSDVIISYYGNATEIEFTPTQVDGSVFGEKYILNINGPTALKGNPFNIKYHYTLPLQGDKYVNIDSIQTSSVRYVYGNWHYTDSNSQHEVYYEQDGKQIKMVNNQANIVIEFDNGHNVVPYYECSGDSNLEVTMVRDDFVVYQNMTFRNVEYTNNVYIDRPFTYMFRNLKVKTNCTLDVLESSIVVEGNLEVEEGATVKCKNLIIN